MKIRNIIAGITLASVVGGGMTACTGDFEKINTNPNTMLVGDLTLNPYGVFEAMFYGFAKRNVTNCFNYSNELVQFTACSSANSNYHRYNFNNSSLESIWSCYAQYAANADHMIKLATKRGDNAALAVAKTLKVLFIANATDIFGDIPYTEAFRQAEGITTPVFDSQQDIYRSMFAELEEANDLYAQSPKWAKPTIDIMYKGDMAKWRKFNNSIYMRLLMRVSGRPEMESAAKLKAMVADPAKYPVISSNAESATVVNTGLDPYYGAYRPSEMTDQTFSSHYLTVKMIDLCLKGGSYTEYDPRLFTIGRTYGGSGEWNGVKSGSVLSEMREDMVGASSPNYRVLVRDDAPIWIFDYSEIQFILAEAALKGMIDGGETAARNYYEKAVRASCEKWATQTQYSKDSYTITEERVNAFLKGYLAGWDNFENKEELIGNQKFLSLFWIGFEAYHELRRTGYPVLTIGNGCSYNNYEFPQRLPYPTNTVGSNGKNVQAALDRMGGDNTMRTPVWWSLKAITGKFTASRPNTPI